MVEQSSPQTAPPQEQPPEPRQAAPQDRRNPWVKLGFVVALIAVAVVVWMLQTRPLSIAGWGDDLSAALRQAQENDSMVVAHFCRRPPSEAAEHNKYVLQKPENVEAMREGNFIGVVVTVDSPSDPLARKYGVDTLPMLVLIDSDGEVVKRHPRKIGEVPFRSQFLAEGE